ncbi:hypothetical protein OGM63_19980 [Plectonema radiosum NIES-515]|uniref:Lipoprotein n=1 Tax=Plectonema radiosum NIES-515 TaxID=2986073 RepID=A0ABT3B457_9CYAN|nr:hypothetical protein [Plectonema radiosum NIES-515]
MINHNLKKITTAIIVAIVSSSCQANVFRKAEQAKTSSIAEEKSQPNIVYGDLILKEQSDYVMIPVRIKDNNQNRRSYLDSSGYSDKEIQFFNIIFFHKRNGETNLLLKKKAIITAFDFLEKKEAGKPSTRFWLYKIIENDTNKDNKLNTQDAIIGYISDSSGKNLQQITPNNTQLINWTIIQSVGAILLKVIEDSDNDKKFTERDKINFLKVNINKPAIGTEIITDQIDQEIKSYILK